MIGSALRMAFLAVCLHLTCNAASAVTWFDGNVRPDGATDSSSNASVYVAPSPDDGAQVIQASSSDGVEIVGDVFDSGD